MHTIIFCYSKKEKIPKVPSSPVTDDEMGESGGGGGTERGGNFTARLGAKICRVVQRGCI